MHIYIYIVHHEITTFNSVRKVNNVNNNTIIKTKINKCKQL